MKEAFKEIYEKHKGLLFLMAGLLVGGLALLVAAIATLNPGAAVANIGYSDVGGYRTGSWVEMAAFAVLALVLAVVHNFLAVRFYQKRGEGWARVLVLVSLGIVAGAFVALVRLLGES